MSAETTRDPMREENLIWPFSGGDVRDLGRDGAFVATPLHAARPDEVVARVDAVCICSSDVKLIRMGADHPLFAERDLSSAPVVLGHEIAVTVVDVGEEWAGRYRPGQRLGLQPAIIKDGQRLTVGVDLPGGLSRYIRMDRTLLGDTPGPYVFDVPEDLSAATIALLEPYACVEAAYRPNSRTAPKPGGRLLIAGKPDAAGLTLDLDIRVAEAVLVDPPPALRRWAEAHAEAVRVEPALPAGENLFDDVVLCGRHTADEVARALAVLRRNGLLALVAADPDTAYVPTDVGRIHYHGIALVGSRGPRVEDAFDSLRNRFDVRPGGTSLILGAGGAMGRIHVHRALELENGPATVIATSRKGARLDALRRDFAPLAAHHGRTLLVVDDAELGALLPRVSPLGVDEAVVVAPNVAAIERAATFLAPGGMLVLFAGVAAGERCRLPLSRIVTDGLRITGSTGCTVEDQLWVLDRVVKGALDPTENLEAVAGFDAVPDALQAVTEGRLAGKIAIYPNVLGLPLTPISELKPAQEESGGRWTLEDERTIANRA